MRNVRDSQPSSFCRRVMLVLLALALSVVGCQSSADADHEHEEEAHARPLHMPASFVEAIPDLTRRFEEMKQTVTDRTEPSKQAIIELQDVVHWLPMLAGESDLRKADWDSVNKLSQELEKKTAGWSAEIKGSIQVDAAIEQILKTLRPLAEKAELNSQKDWQ